MPFELPLVDSACQRVLKSCCDSQIANRIHLLTNHFTHSFVTADLPHCISRRNGCSTASRWRRYSRRFRIDLHSALYHVHVLAYLGQEDQKEAA